jgi:hypothetical protein
MDRQPVSHLGLLSGREMSHTKLVRFRFELMPALPKLAWAAHIRQDDPVLEVFHGPHVEVRESAFVEGAWDQPFDTFRFDESPVLVGSGARITPDGVLFAAPANMYERLYSVRCETAKRENDMGIKNASPEEMFVSNSLAFALSLSGEKLDPGYPHYYTDFLDHHRVGIREKSKWVRLAGGRKMAFHDCCNFEIALDLQLTRAEKNWQPVPSCYREYASLLYTTVERLFENAGARERCWKYRPVVMISQGYDTTAAAALAAKAGCREAVTFFKSGSGQHGYSPDDGFAIAATLGYTMTGYERKDFAQAPGYRVEEFYMEPGGIDRCMAVMADQLAGSILLGGRSGDTVWARGNSGSGGMPGINGQPNLEEPIDCIPGCALGEFRLRIGYLQFHPATVAAIHAPVIQRWNATKEMRPWSLRRPYDKPIARRIAEEAGVPRHLFGQEKKGGMHVWKQRATGSPLVRALVRGTLGIHPMWRRESLEVQAGVEKMMQRYREAMVFCNDE